ncbi:unnamed protein product, partial [Mesorhabditis spiculigera]
MGWDPETSTHLERSQSLDTDLEALVVDRRRLMFQYSNALLAIKSYAAPTIPEQVVGMNYAICKRDVQQLQSMVDDFLMRHPVPTPEYTVDGLRAGNVYLRSRIEVAAHIVRLRRELFEQIGLLQGSSNDTGGVQHRLNASHRSFDYGHDDEDDDHRGPSIKRARSSDMEY